ncbi:MAG: hypothetical protein AB7G44_03725 [Bacteroidia bacterium]
MKDNIKANLTIAALLIIAVASIYIFYNYTFIWAFAFIVIPFLIAYWRWGNHKQNSWLAITLYGALFIIPFLGIFNNREVEIWIGTNFIDGFEITGGYEYYADNETGSGDSEWSDNIPTYPKGSFWGNHNLNTTIIAIELLWFFVGLKTLATKRDKKLIE